MRSAFPFKFSPIWSVVSPRWFGFTTSWFCSVVTPPQSFYLTEFQKFGSPEISFFASKMFLVSWPSSLATNRVYRFSLLFFFLNYYKWCVCTFVYLREKIRYAGLLPKFSSMCVSFLMWISKMVFSIKQNVFPRVIDLFYISLRFISNFEEQLSKNQ